MRYMLLIYRDETQLEGKPVQDRRGVYQAAFDYSEAHRHSGLYQGGSPLEYTHTATTVRMKDGKVVITDGPFAETKEQMGGYTILEARNLDEVLAFVTNHPLVKAGLTMEVRPIREGPPK